MGSSISKKERSERPSKSGEYAALASKTPFSLSEVEALNELFTKLSSSIVQDKHISKEELQLALFQHCNKQNLFLDRIFDLFDAKRNGHIDFGEFVEALSIFHPKTPDAVKIKYAFKLYDLRQTGYIEIEELKAMVVALLNESDLMLSDDVVQMIVDKTFKEADTKGDGRIDVEEWKEYAEKNPSVLKNMTLPYLMCVPTPLIVNNTHPSRSLLNKSCQFMGANSQCQHEFTRNSLCRMRYPYITIWKI